MKVTKEEVDKAEAAAHAADAAFNATCKAVYAVHEAAWDKYIKLKEEYDNESN